MRRRPSAMLAASLAVVVVGLFVAPTPAQAPEKIPHIGYLWLGAEGSDRATTLPGFKQGLRELGYTEGGDIVIEYRYAAGSRERLRELVADTVASKADVIVAPGVIVADAVKQATATIPVVAVTTFAMRGDEERIRDAGCDAYLSKPISVPKFIETIRRFLGVGQSMPAVSRSRQAERRRRN